MTSSSISFTKRNRNFIFVNMSEYSITSAVIVQHWFLQCQVRTWLVTYATLHDVLTFFHEGKVSILFGEWDWRWWKSSWRVWNLDLNLGWDNGNNLNGVVTEHIATALDRSFQPKHVHGTIMIPFYQNIFAVTMNYTHVRNETTRHSHIILRTIGRAKWTIQQKKRKTQ